MTNRELFDLLGKPCVPLGAMCVNSIAADNAVDTMGSAFNGFDDDFVYIWMQTVISILTEPSEYLPEELEIEAVSFFAQHGVTA